MWSGPPAIRVAQPDVATTNARHARARTSAVSQSLSTVSSWLSGEPVAHSALALDQIVGLHVAELTAHAVDELADVLAVGLHRAERQRIGDLVPRDICEL